MTVNSRNHPQSFKSDAGCCLWMAKAKGGNNAPICRESIAARGFIIIHLPEKRNYIELVAQ